MIEMATGKRCLPATITPGVPFDVGGFDGVMVCGVADAGAWIRVQAVVDGDGVAINGAEALIGDAPATFMVDVRKPDARLQVIVEGDAGYDIYALPYLLKPLPSPLGERE